MENICGQGCCQMNSSGQGYGGTHSGNTSIKPEENSISVQRVPLYLCPVCRGAFIGYRTSILDRITCINCNDRGWVV